MSDRVDTAVVLVAGGRGARFGSEQGKQLTLAAGAPVLAHALSAALGVRRVGLVVVVCDPSRVSEYSQALAGVLSDVEVRYVAGGERRQDSVAAGLAEVPEGRYDHIAVHDGARPLLRSSTFHEALTLLDERSDLDGVVVGHPSFDTLKIVEDGVISGTPDRTRYWVAQTPQVFREAVLRSAYAEAEARKLESTDDAGIVEAAGGVVGVLEGPRDNIKVTVASDLTLVEGVLKARREDETR